MRGGRWLRANAWLNQPQVKASGKPVFVPKPEQINGEWVNGGKWSMERPAGEWLGLERECERVGAPVRPDEEPAGYIYIAKAKSQFRYAPLYARMAEELDPDKLTDLDHNAIAARRRCR